jgi:hypothetical protein
MKIKKFLLTIYIAFLFPFANYLLIKLIKFFEVKASRTFELRYATIYPLLIYLVLGVLLVITHLSMDYAQFSIAGILVGITVYALTSYYVLFREPKALIFNMICLGFYLTEFILRLIMGKLRKIKES